MYKTNIDVKGEINMWLDAPTMVVLWLRNQGSTKQPQLVQEEVG